MIRSSLQIGEFLRNLSFVMLNVTLWEYDGVCGFNKKENDNMKDFVAIDFETANYHPTSICSVGVAIVRNGEIVQKFYRLVKPYPNEYSWHCQQVHGLSDKDTCCAPLFPEVWAEIAPWIQGLQLVAHNKSFDESRLKACFAHYGMPYEYAPFLCTCQTAKKVFPHLEDHKLPTVSAHCGFELTNHHHALADAEACAVLGIKVL